MHVRTRALANDVMHICGERPVDPVGAGETLTHETRRDVLTSESGVREN